MSASRPYSLIVIDDHPLFRKGVAQLLELDAGFVLAGEASSGRDGVALARETQPDLILLDLNMKGMNGIETLKALKQQEPASLVIMLTVSNAEKDLVRALRAGADGYLLKDMEPEELLDRLRNAIAGETVMDPSLTGMLADALREDNATQPAADATLTDREQEILGLIAAGMSNKMIARELTISDGTVKVHVKNLLRKLNLRSRLEAAVWALGQGSANN
ncbi:MAG: two-component system response regulator NarL [Gammaproteobacteria bacterium]